VRRWTGKTMPVQHGLHFLRGMVSIARKLDFAITDGRDLGEFSLEIVLHHFPDGVKLHADFFYLVSFGCPRKLAGQHSGGSHRTQKSSSVHFRVLLASSDPEHNPRPEP